LDPVRLASIRELDRYFEDLAQRIADEVTDLAEAYYRAETSGGEPDDLVERVGLRSMARLRAEEAVLPAYLAEHGGLG
jgi:hypothetical protein